MVLWLKYVIFLQLTPSSSAVEVRLSIWYLPYSVPDLSQLSRSGFGVEIQHVYLLKHPDLLPGEIFTGVGLKLLEGEGVKSLEGVAVKDIALQVYVDFRDPAEEKLNVVKVDVGGDTFVVQGRRDGV